MPKPKDPTNYLLPDIPDFNKIFAAYQHLYKRPPRLKEVKELQKLWLENANH